MKKIINMMMNDEMMRCDEEKRRSLGGVTEKPFFQFLMPHLCVGRSYCEGTWKTEGA